jgi:hypothetical protein
MSTRGFSRRDLLNLGGKLVMSIGAAKIVVTLPGCGGDSSSVDALPATPDAYYGYSYYTLDDCHAIGTYHYAQTYPGGPGYAYTYHYYWTGAYGCPYDYPYGAPSTLQCYPDVPDFAPGYDYFCFTGYYETITYP